MKIKVEFSRQGNFIITLLLIYFVFFGYLANVFPTSYNLLYNIETNIGEKLLFLYQVLFHPESFFSLIILIAIVFFMVFREQFYEYGIRNAFWLTPIIILLSWFWYWFVADYDFTFLAWYFIRIETYITIVTLYCVIMLTAIIAATAKEKYKSYKERLLKITI